MKSICRRRFPVFSAREGKMKHSMSLLLKRKILAASLLAGLTAFSPPIYAVTQSFTSAILGGNATFTTNNGGTVTVTLTDTHTFDSTSSNADLFTDISFSVTNGGAVTTSSVTTTANFI